MMKSLADTADISVLDAMGMRTLDGNQSTVSEFLDAMIFISQHLKFI